MAFRNSNKMIVESLYDSLAKGDTLTASTFLADDLDWRFHGPRKCQHMSKLLTGEAGPTEFKFVPTRVVHLLDDSSWVIAEGFEGEQAYWVHAWEIENGVIIRFREYFNTFVTVQEIGCGAHKWRESRAVWQSQSQDRKQTSRSLPGLVLAI
ncbi:hypothetical protein LUZ60_003886 [Juncus effusus]|nr:hypothetical protein LUZ60_003886 [Juncus effusus]